MSRIYLTTFDTYNALIEALAGAGLAPEGEPDTRYVDAFRIWPRIFGPVPSPGGEVEIWHEDTNQPEQWTANLALAECPAALEAYEIEPPQHPRRV